MATINAPANLTPDERTRETHPDSPDPTVASLLACHDRQPADQRHGPEMVKQFQEVINALEADGQVRVVVFDSAVDEYFLESLGFYGQD